MEDRANALLTKAQREALREGGSGEYTRQYRQRIRERTRNGTLDLSLLFQRMEQKDIERTFGPDLRHLEELRDLAGQIENTISGRSERYELMELRDELRGYVDTEEKSPSQSNAQLNSFSTTAPASEDFIESEVASQIEDLISKKQDVLSELHEIESRLKHLSESKVNDPEQFSSDYFEQLWSLLDDTIEMREYELADLKQTASLLEDDPMQGARDVIEIANEMAHGMRGRYSEKGGRKMDGRALQSSIRSIRSEIEDHIENATFASGMKEHVTKSLAFYLRISEVLGADTESIAREALLRTHQHQYPERTIGDVSVEVSSENRTKASRRAIEQLQGGERWLDVTELRALAETNPAELRKLVEIEDITENEIRNAVLARPDSIEEDLEIVDEQPRVTGDGRVPDMVGRDRDGKLVLIELKRSLEDVDKRITEGLGELINEYGGPERARAVVVYPAETAGQASTPRSDAANLEFVPIRVRFD